MKKLFLTLICGILGLSVVTGCDKENTTNIEETNNNQQNDINVNNDIQYSKCAKKGKQCTDEDIYNGQLVNISVNEKQSYDFYIISDNGTTLTLVMNGPLGNPVSWTSSNDQDNVFKDINRMENNNFGPYTLLKELNNLTSDWTNIKAIDNFEYNRPEDDSSGYLKLNIVNGVASLTSANNKVTDVPGISRARILSVSEIKQISGESGIYASWLIERLKEEYQEDMEPSDAHLWLLDSEKNLARAAYALTIFNTIDPINVEDELLLFPVITIDKKDIK